MNSDRGIGRQVEQRRFRTGSEFYSSEKCSMPTLIDLWRGVYTRQTPHATDAVLEDRKR
jgi:hypothetical protein